MSSWERGIISNYDLKKPRVKIGYVIMCLFIVLLGVTMLYPFLNTLFSSLKTKQEMFTFPVPFFPKEWIWHNYVEAWDTMNLLPYMRNTIIIFVGNMVFSIFFMGLAAYSLSHLKVPYRKWFILFFLSTLLIPTNSYLIPNFLNLQSLGLLNSYWAFWLPAGANAFNLLLLKTFFDGIHKELFEAARVDGASEIRCYLQLAIPLSLPIIATLVILGFSATWNEWYWPSLVITSKEKYPLATVIYRYVIAGGVGGTQIPWNVRFALLASAMLPPVVFFLFMQKYIMRGLNVSGIKG
ncbi:carbohydrate ABC transporter permease [Paenibacillus sp. N1-5-1-14]|uniref:carbohydrate ABC transporter permease n=1 Tax=Paenibacillus radicibacter TaxID=2972488 RepID=UPI002158CADA|nr:carbohydrate ABC transporter permease [Paenibacillus radicibacter]MCR8642538.1 carbohydrate ABC transporter permease [Paenibacillus radicibacter]